MEVSVDLDGVGRYAGGKLHDTGLLWHFFFFLVFSVLGVFQLGLVALSAVVEWISFFQAGERMRITPDISRRTRTGPACWEPLVLTLQIEGAMV